MAGSPYARTVMSSSTKPVSALPDPGLLFDLLLRRDPNEAPKPHPGNAFLLVHVCGPNTRHQAV
jgi:hypothetical protein